MAQAAAPPPTAMVVGKSGMGKSTLCNYLLYGKPRPRTGGFLARGGTDPVTSGCEAQAVNSTEPPKGMTGSGRAGGRLRMIDTPGIPDPDGRTLKFYNDIVRTLRRAGGLNALIVNVCYNVDRVQVKQDFGTYGILLQQFEKIPCLKILLCRVRIQSDLEPDQIEEDLRPVDAWVQEVLRNGGMSKTIVKYLFDNDTQAQQLFQLRQVLTEMPWTPIEPHNIRTFEELEESVQRLVTLNTRSDALRQKRVDLEKEKSQLDERNIFLGRLMVGAYLTVILIPWAATSLRKEKNFNEWRKTAIKDEVVAIDEELKSGVRNRDALRRDKRTLDDLKKVAQVHVEERASEV